MGLDLRPLPGGIAAVPGVRAGAVAAGIKKKGGLDLALIVSEGEPAAAGVYTTNRVAAAPVRLCRERVGRGPLRAILANSGNANACTGEGGYRDAVALAVALARLLGLPEGQVVMASTGVIGERLPRERIERALPALVASLSPEGGEAAARAILTTDTRAKLAAFEVPVHRTSVHRTSVHRTGAGGDTLRVGGIAKGAGMIAPSLATMLAFLATDAALGPEALGAALRAAVEESFNAVTVDGDMSTNDTVLLFANGQSGLRPEGELARQWEGALRATCRALAQAIVRDGEGATKCVEVRVSGAASEEDARRAARTVAESLLVKTALFGGDPNWGRVLAAAGRSGARVEPLRVSLDIGEVAVVRGGEPVRGAWEKEAAAVMARGEFSLHLDLGLGGGSARVWTTDLSPEYVRLNAEYRT